jgi:hypothetical protein
VNKGSSRDLISAVQKRVTRLQKEHSVPAYNVTVFENSGGLHAHIVFISDRAGEIVAALKRSRQFGELVDAKPVYDLQGLFNYLTKERTPQANYRRGHMFGGRLKGSHPIDGGGDRVRPNAELKRDAIQARYIELWQQTNARRSKDRKPYRSRELKRRTLHPGI